MATCSEHAFHVDRNGERWDVMDQEGRIIGNSRGQAEAIELAIREAQHADGAAIVCVEQADGHYNLVWSSR